MQAKFSTIRAAGIFAAACAAAILLPAGCESSNHQATLGYVPSGSTETCPVCGTETRTQPFTRLKYTTCVCPTCKEVSAIDPETLEKIEDVFGYLPEFRVTVCEGCGAVVRECTTCREARG